MDGYRLWQHEVKSNLEECVERVVAAVRGAYKGAQLLQGECIAGGADHGANFQEVSRHRTRRPCRRFAAEALPFSDELEKRVREVCGRRRRTRK